MPAALLLFIDEPGWLGVTVFTIPATAIAVGFLAGRSGLKHLDRRLAHK